VIRDHGVDSIVHVAHTSNYEAPIYTCLQNNVLGIINVMEAAAIGSVKKVTYMSAGSVVGGQEGYSGKLEDEFVPIGIPAGSANSTSSVIGPSHKCGEVLVAYYGATFGISVAMVRGGGGGFWGLYREGPIGNAAVLGDIMEQVVTGKPVDLPNVGKEQKFRLSYGRDIGAAISVVHLAPKNQHLVYVIPGGEPTSWGEIDEIIKELVPGAKITFGKSERPAREERPLPEEMNITSEFGFKLKYGIKEALRELTEWYQKGRP
ncbi:NAD-dependent epimerase/dehydratase family protein, partial [Chloroflexota bacterium]